MQPISPSVTPHIEIPLTQGQVAIISSEDADLARVKWHAIFSPHYADDGKYLAKRHSPTINGKQRTIYLHNLILMRMIGRDLVKGERCDHVNLDTLDNRRENLRLATHTQNLANQRRHRNNTSGFKGVGWHNQRNKWQARISINGHHIFLGLFDDPKEAHAAYCAAAVKYFGDFARFE